MFEVELAENNILEVKQLNKWIALLIFSLFDLSFNLPFMLHHIETSRLICTANELTGFYMMATLALNVF